MAALRNYGTMGVLKSTEELKNEVLSDFDIREKTHRFVILLLNTVRLQFFFKPQHYGVSSFKDMKPQLLLNLNTALSDVLDNNLVSELVLKASNFYGINLDSINDQPQSISALCLHLASKPEIYEICQNIIHEAFYEHIKKFIKEVLELKTSTAELPSLFTFMLRGAHIIVSNKVKLQTAQILSAVIDHVRHVRHEA